MPKELHFVTLDVFTSDIFAGNPLPDDDQQAICQRQKQAIAREFNYSETIFIHPVASEASSKRKIDIFMTTKELPFAGHPTIGAAFWLLCLSPHETERNATKMLTTKAGDIAISRSLDSAVVSVTIPHNVHLHKERFPVAEVLRLHPSLRPFLEADGLGSNGYSVLSVVKGMTVIPVELPSVAASAAIRLINLYFFVRNVPDGGRAVIRTRMLLGTFEDAATGSSAVGLGLYLSLYDQGRGTGTRHEYDIVQGVEMGRKSNIGVQVVLTDDSKRVETVKLSGGAVKVSEGQIRLN
ncbi:PhzF family phenazine biosynthesis protein [Aspergillus thermomutatus]|uniref:Phenazine biosynthesis protein n=1 Tax=Aspergillus thermomutatus TaxID=41047 RepID=A0A397HU76_ASPTH|nr:uncharacterized protein CDV56_108671 [Aspergillus thermomutatus]RHZ65518.1 hypothetical protein CDV56_108671 [Aspergillus thermomutatus]